MNDLKSILATDCKVNHLDLSIHGCGFQTYEQGYSQNSQNKKGGELDKKRSNLGQKKK